MQLNYRGDKGNLSNNPHHGTSNGMMGSQRDDSGKEGAEFFANFKGRFPTMKHSCKIDPIYTNNHPIKTYICLISLY